jgi:hypothetical protein
MDYLIVNKRSVIRGEGCVQKDRFEVKKNALALESASFLNVNL